MIFRFAFFGLFVGIVYCKSQGRGSVDDYEAYDNYSPEQPNNGYNPGMYRRSAVEDLTKAGKIRALAKKKREARFFFSIIETVITHFLKFKWFILSHVLGFVLGFLKNNFKNLIGVFTWLQHKVTNNCDTCESVKIPDVDVHNFEDINFENWNFEFVMPTQNI